MRSIDILNEIDKNHGLKELVGKSLMSWTMLWYRDIYNEFDVYIKMGNPPTEAALLTAVKLNIGVATVYRAKKQMES
jgi:hypothetical protein